LGIVFILNLAEVLGKKHALAKDPKSALHLVSDNTAESQGAFRLMEGARDPNAAATPEMSVSEGRAGRVGPAANSAR
jgi:hypothetical protein